MLSETLVNGIQKKKGKEIVRLDLTNVANAVSDYFIICHGTSKTQVEAIADAVEEEAGKNLGMDPWHKEGFENAEWVLIDFVDVVVHIFQEQTRRFYDLEGLWADAEMERYTSSD
ncbi:MAG: ribosome silencing factor [Bacteroidales bacterium]|nr:ribosome silencing factor [Bacteroidales bacterium]